MVSSTARLESFLALMSESPEAERHGFELILGRLDFETYFDHLQRAGFFDESRCSAPQPANEPGYYYVPHWAALGYLDAVAKKAGEANDTALAEKVLEVVRRLSRSNDADRKVRDNYHTASAFASILSLVPRSAVALNDIDLIAGWLGGQFGTALIGDQIDAKLLPRFLSDNTPESVEKACKIINHVTALRWEESATQVEAAGRANLAIDDYWLGKLIERNGQLLGAHAGKKAADILFQRLSEVYSKERDGGLSWMHRPAIEDHLQNHPWRGAHNRLVEGFREIMLGWIDASPADAVIYVQNLLASELQIARRLALFLVDARFGVLKALVTEVLAARSFDSANLHELYSLLKRNFQEFGPQEKSMTLEAIRSIAPSEGEGEIKDGTALCGLQLRWLSAIEGKGSAEADRWYEKLIAERAAGQPPTHPDFLAYIETRSGFGPTPYTPDQLAAFAQGGILIEQLNSFTEVDSWNGPTTRSLVDALESAIQANPRLFGEQISHFSKANRPFQYGVIEGFRKLWKEKKEDAKTLDWTAVWRNLLNLFEGILFDSQFWSEAIAPDAEEHLTPTRHWIPGAIADFLEAGTRDDKWAYPSELLPIGWRIILQLLQKSEGVTAASESDAMFQAVNSQKGKAIEAMVSHALRTCRIADQVEGTHERAWREVEPVFENELQQCRNANFEFSTLAACYLGHVQYMGPHWSRANVGRIFSEQYPGNLQSAIEGLAYAISSEDFYALLKEGNVVSLALRQHISGRHGREKLMQRIAVAYLWGQEKLDGPAMSFLFDSQQVSDLEEIAEQFWRVSNEPLSSSQKDLVLAFWEKSVKWSETEKEWPVGPLMVALSKLTSYLPSLGKRESALLLAVAPYITSDVEADHIFEELQRFLPSNPNEVCQLVGSLLSASQPRYDYENHLRNLLEGLASVGGDVRLATIEYVDRLSKVNRDMLPLYKQLMAEN